MNRYKITFSPSLTKKKYLIICCTSYDIILYDLQKESPCISIYIL